MLTLYGFAISNYYNKIKIQLLEKGIPFKEELVWPNKEESTLSLSPAGKVPYIMTEQGPLCESAVIADYLEAAYPANPLIPKDAYQAAKMRELITFLEMHVELSARELYAQAFFGGTVTDETKNRAQKNLKKYITAFIRLAKFSPFVAGDTFSLADCSAAVNLPLVSLTTKAVFGEDILANTPAGDYMKMINARPVMLQVNADRKANVALRAQLNQAK